MYEHYVQRIWALYLTVLIDLLGTYGIFLWYYRLLVSKNTRKLELFLLKNDQTNSPAQTLLSEQWVQLLLTLLRLLLLQPDL